MCTIERQLSKHSSKEMGITNSMWGIIGTILGASLGWSFGLLSKRLQTWEDDKKARKEVIFYLLEFRFLLARQKNFFDTVQHVVEKLVLRLPDLYRTPEMKKHFQKQITPAILPFVRENTQNRVEKILDSFDSTVIKLAGIDPVLAYKLTGQEQGLGFAKLFDEYFARVKEHLGSEEEIDLMTQSWTDMINSQVSMQAVSNLDEIIDATARPLSKKQQREIRIQIMNIDRHFDSHDEDHTLDFIIDDVVAKIAV